MTQEEFEEKLGDIAQFSEDIASEILGGSLDKALELTQKREEICAELINYFYGGLDD